MPALGISLNKTGVVWLSPTFKEISSPKTINISPSWVYVIISSFSSVYAPAFAACSLFAKNKTLSAKFSSCVIPKTVPTVLLSVGLARTSAPEKTLFNSPPEISPTIPPAISPLTSAYVPLFSIVALPLIFAAIEPAISPLTLALSILTSLIVPLFCTAITAAVFSPLISALRINTLLTLPPFCMFKNNAASSAVICKFSIA